MSEATLRETLSTSFDKVETEAATAEPTQTETTAEPAKIEAVTPEPVKVEAKTEPVKVEETKTEPVKVEATKTIPAKKEPAKLEPKVGLRAPESWKPAIREQHWGKLPPAVQSEIYRRERQIDEALQSSAEARKGMESFQGLVTNFKDVFEYEKLPPMQTISSLLNISRTLRFSPAPTKAQLMAQVIQGFGIDVKLLDQALSMLVTPSDPAAQQAQNNSAAIEQALARQLGPVREFMSTITQNRQAAQQKSDTDMQKEIETFANDPANEYFEVVKDGMADILELGAKRGQKISLQDAYKRAILANNDLAGQYSQQTLTQAAERVNAPAALALRRANLSVTGSPSGEAAPAAGVNLRADLEAAVAKHSGR